MTIRRNLSAVFRLNLIAIIDVLYTTEVRNWEDSRQFSSFLYSGGEKEWNFLAERLKLLKVTSLLHELCPGKNTSYDMSAVGLLRSRNF
jgi:hypothetical protein